MLSQRTPPGSRPAAGPMLPARGLLVLSGYGLRLAIERGRLVAADGIGAERRAGTIGRADRLQRLVVIGHSGTITLDVLRWCADVGCGLVVIDPDGRLLATAGATGRDEPTLRRAQALAEGSPIGLRLMGELLDAKLSGQAQVVAGLPQGPEAAETIERLRRALRAAPDADSARIVEAAAAIRYWQAVADVPVRFGSRGPVPAAWRTFGSRTSPLSGGPRRAVTPANAMLNYLYAIAEAETRLAALTIGLDPGLGVLHADQHARDSMALDLVEAIRPSVDGFLLDVLAGRTFGARDFGELPDGTVRVAAALAAALGATGARWRQAVAPWAEHVVAVLLDGSGARRTTPLTGDHRSTGRTGTRQGTRRLPSLPGLRLRPACQGCGEATRDATRALCDACLSESRRVTLAAFKRAGPAAIATARAAGQDPSHGGRAALARGTTQSVRRRDELAWQGAPTDPAVFGRDVLPAIASVPLGVLRERTGLSIRYVSLIRRGLRVPHRRWWSALAGEAEYPNDLSLAEIARR